MKRQLKIVSRYVRIHRHSYVSTSVDVYMRVHEYLMCTVHKCNLYPETDKI